MKSYTSLEQSKKLAKAIEEKEYFNLLKETSTYNMSQAIINLEKTK